MHKRILIAEQNDTIRGVAETVLRQNGYEVISVSSADKVYEVLDFSLPHLFLISATLMGSDNRPCFEGIQDHPRASSVPMLVLAGPEGTVSSLPEEIVIPQPFDPDVLLQRVAAFTGQSDAQPTKDASNPLGEADFDDEFLDAALGIDVPQGTDSIQVTDSEDMDKTVMGVKPDQTRKEKMLGLGHYGKEDDLGDSSKVESLILSDETSEIKHSSDVREKAKDDLSMSSGIDIMSDQYGLADPDAFNTDNGDAAHDYDWFVNSMRDDGDPAAPPAAGTKGGGGEELSFTDPASIVDPVTPGPTALRKPAPDTKASSAATGGEGVDKFINEFKKEIERIRSDEPDGADLQRSSSASPNEVQAAPSEGGVVWEEKVEKIAPEHAELFTRELINAVAEKVAERLTARLDPEKLLQMIRSEIIDYFNKNPKS